jgi:hypothetical protein
MCLVEELKHKTFTSLLDRPTSLYWAYPYVGQVGSFAYTPQNNTHPF